MFNKNFYPTPFSVIQEMVWPHRERLNDKCFVLEPSVGKWDIAKFIKEMSYGGRVKIHGIEPEPELAELAKKYCSIVGSDFLEFEADTDYDLIIMNPPFDRGDEHLLKAWGILRNWSIACLLNAETIDNPYSEKRKLLARIIEDNGGTVEYLGDCFNNAERKTGVNVALVRLTKVTPHSSMFGQMEEEVEKNYNDIFTNELATLDIVGNLVRDYEQIKELYAQWVALIRKADKMGASISNNNYLEPFKIAHEWGTVRQIVQNYSEMLKMWVWNNIVDRLDVERFMTQKVRDDFREKMSSQKNIAISKKNIMDFVSALMQNWADILEENISAVFDHFTKYYAENREYVEGWKTNERWKVWKRVILPNIIDTQWNNIRICYSKENQLSDIDKALCYISGKNLKEISSLHDSLRENMKQGLKGWESEFFKFKWYLKGTLHLEFKDKFLWQEFNTRACAKRQWLPAKEEQEWRQSNQFVKI